MITLYLNNFRGFKNTIIPIADVNFLVGENSTGKSSLLALLNLLCSNNFWFSENFNQEYEFGVFHDILSAGCKKNEEFSFGLSISLNPTNKRKEKDYTFLMSYREKKALPTLALFTLLEDNELVSIRKHGDKFHSYAKNLNIQPLANKNLLFSFLQKQSSLSNSNFKIFPKDPIFESYPFVVKVDDIIRSHKGKSVLYPYIIKQLFSPGIVWLAPIRSKPRRTYDDYSQPYSPEGKHTPYLIRMAIKSSDNRAKYFQKMLSSFGVASGLFSEVVTQDFGDDAASPFELMIHLNQKYKFRINSIGYGVSQILPIVVEMLLRREGFWFAMQQPEVHLHPRAQAALGDIIYSVAEKDSKRFFIETHSDFTIDRFRMKYRDNPKHKTTAQVLFFVRDESGNHVHIIPIEKNGEYSDKQPPAFREFFLKEQMNILGL